VLLVLLVVLATMTYIEKGETKRALIKAEAATQRAVAATKAADELINYMQYDLSEALGKLGRLDMMNAVNARIMKYYEGHPPEAGDLDAIRERSVALTQQGDVQSAQGDRAGALKSCGEFFVSAEKFAKKDPGNVSWQRDLAFSYERVGDVQSDQEDLAGALKSYRQSLSMRDELAKQEPRNVLWQGELAWIYWKTGSVWSKAEPKSKSEALTMAEKGRHILRQLKERTGLTAIQQGWLDSIEADLREMQEKK
jgi:hypothetical protein